VTWGEYIEKCVEQLAESRSVGEFKAVLQQIERDLTGFGSDAEKRELFWREVEAKYAKAPKLLLEDTTAAEKLFALYMHASDMLAAAMQRSIAAAPKK